MRSFILILLATTVGALEIPGLPKEVNVDPKQIHKGQTSVDWIWGMRNAGS